MDRIRRYGRKKFGIKLMIHLWLHFIFGLMVGELEGTLNKEVVMVHCGDLALWVEKEQ